MSDDRMIENDELKTELNEWIAIHFKKSKPVPPNPEDLDFEISPPSNLKTPFVFVILFVYRTILQLFLR